MKEYERNAETHETHRDFTMYNYGRIYCEIADNIRQEPLERE